MCRSSRHYIQTIQKRCCSTFRQIFIIILHAMHMFNVTYWHYFDLSGPSCSKGRQRYPADKSQSTG